MYMKNVLKYIGQDNQDEKPPDCIYFFECLIIDFQNIDKGHRVLFHQKQRNLKIGYDIVFTIVDPSDCHKINDAWQPHFLKPVNNFLKKQHVPQNTLVFDL